MSPKTYGQMFKFFAEELFYFGVGLVTVRMLETVTLEKTSYCA